MFLKEEYLIAIQIVAKSFFNLEVFHVSISKKYKCLVLIDCTLKVNKLWALLSATLSLLEPWGWTHIELEGFPREYLYYMVTKIIEEVDNKVFVNIVPLYLIDKK